MHWVCCAILLSLQITLNGVPHEVEENRILHAIQPIHADSKGYHKESNKNMLNTSSGLLFEVTQHKEKHRENIFPESYIKRLLRGIFQSNSQTKLEGNEKNNFKINFGQTKLNKYINKTHNKPFKNITFNKKLSNEELGNLTVIDNAIKVKNLIVSYNSKSDEMTKNITRNGNNECTVKSDEITKTTFNSKLKDTNEQQNYELLTDGRTHNGTSTKVREESNGGHYKTNIQQKENTFEKQKKLDRRLSGNSKNFLNNKTNILKVNAGNINFQENLLQLKDGSVNEEKNEEIAPSNADLKKRRNILNVNYIDIESDQFNDTYSDDDNSDTNHNFKINKRQIVMELRDSDMDETDEYATTYKQCKELCSVIFVDMAEHFAQAIGQLCFCFRKQDILPKPIKEILKHHKLFGVQQPYE